MTREARFLSASRKKEISYAHLLYGLAPLFFLLLFLKNAEIATSSVKAGLSLCAERLIPSLFPFLVLSELIASSDLVLRLFKKPTFPLQKLLRLSPAGCTALLLGMLCGFPSGTKYASEAYENGRLSQKELERVLPLSNLPSPAFLINAVGISLFQSRRIGVLLYGCTLASALLTGLILLRCAKKEEDASVLEAPLLRRSSKSSVAQFTDAVASAAKGMTLICAYVVFFSAVSGALNAMLQVLHLPTFLQGLSFCILELSGGVSHAASLEDLRVALPLCAYGAGWSGMSVHCQLLALCQGKRLSACSYLTAKLLQGLLCAAFCIASLQILSLSFFLP